ncbi:MAG: FAD-dependent oxidoreductase [Chloroflexi bacterium]|nr:MAG: FAD-dependent oxidoreductase [Chloroflexota bacterium]
MDFKVGELRSYWLREILERDPGQPCPPLDHDIQADVVILGGGYTGLWTAYFLTEYAADRSVVVLEADICGGGASGRNGGFCTGWWDELDGLIELHGKAAAIEACRASGEAITAIGEWCADHGVDAWYRKSGFLEVATSETHERVLQRGAALAAEAGVGEEYTWLSAEQVRGRCNSPRFRAGVLMRDGATVQPARLARGLRRVLLERGVQIFEQTPVLSLDERPVAARTPGGTVRAGRAVVALNAWAGAFRPFRRRIAAWSSYIALTAPAPERLAQTGWINGECITDVRASVHYFRTTPDGRIAMGGGGGQAASANRIGKVFTHDTTAVERAVATLREMFPAFSDVPIEAGWGGPIDVSPTHRAFFGTLASGAVHYGLGYTGNGVGPSYLGGRILAALALDRDDRYVRLPLVGLGPKLFPPEPFRSLGARMIRMAMLRQDDADERDRTADPLSRLIAHLPRRMGYQLGP